MTSCLTNLYYYSYVNANLQLIVPMTSVSHSLSCPLKLTISHPSSPDCWVIYYCYFSWLRIQPSVILPGYDVLYLEFLRSVESILPTYLSAAYFHYSAFNYPQSCQHVERLFHPDSDDIKGIAYF
jgi:hypothetical protein